MQRYNDKLINKHYVYLDDDLYPILFPCLFARYTQVSQYRVDIESRFDESTRRKADVFVEREIGVDAAYKITNHLGRFLEWVNRYEAIENVTLATHTALPSDVINEYINEYLIEECFASEFVARQAINSLNAYYNWLFYFFKNQRKTIGIKSSYRETARNNNIKTLAVKYILPASRELIYRTANSQLEEIVLRNGGELGCRAKENQGFLLNDQKISNKTEHGLLTLFEQLETQPEQTVFKYYLSSLYTKYGRSRMLYIPRYLLEKMKRYYIETRPRSDSNHLLLTSSKNSYGQPISKKYASEIFLKVKLLALDKIAENPDIYTRFQDISLSTYHHLRHSFGTDIFYELCLGHNKHFESITTTSAIYLETARRLGHKVDGRNSPEVTKVYIHSCGHRESLMKEAA